MQRQTNDAREEWRQCKNETIFVPWKNNKYTKQKICLSLNSNTYCSLDSSSICLSLKYWHCEIQKAASISAHTYGCMNAFFPSVFTVGAKQQSAQQTLAVPNENDWMKRRRKKKMRKNSTIAQNVPIDFVLTQCDSCLSLSSSCQIRLSLFHSPFAHSLWLLFFVFFFQNSNSEQ